MEKQNNTVLKDIPGYNDFVKIKQLENSVIDKKYYIETADSQRLFLRVNEIEERADYDYKKAEYKRMERMYKSGIPMPRPVAFGECNGGKHVYQLTTWLDGETIGNSMSESEQYEAGIKAGEILRKIHSVPIVDTDMTDETWNERFCRVVDREIKAFRESGVKIDDIEVLIDYYNNNRHLMKTRPRCYTHLDYVDSNIMYSAEKSELYIIDWERGNFDGYADPWFDLTYRPQFPLHFVTGKIRGYFGGEPPEDLWYVYKFYKYMEQIIEPNWGYMCSHHSGDYMESVAGGINEVLNTFADIKSPIPVPDWYLKDLHAK